MKHISYYDIAEGSFALFNKKEDILVEIIDGETYWVYSSPNSFSIFGKTKNIVFIPTWQLTFSSQSDLNQFLTEKTSRDGYYLVAGRNCDKDELFISPKGPGITAYFSCFGLAYAPTDFIKSTHHWTSLKSDSELPPWLTDLGDQYQISHIKNK